MSLVLVACAEASPTAPPSAAALTPATAPCVRKFRRLTALASFCSSGLPARFLAMSSSSLLRRRSCSLLSCADPKADFGSTYRGGGSQGSSPMPDVDDLHL